MIKTSGAQESDCYSGKLLDGSFSDDYATIPVHAGDTLPLFFLRYKLVKCTFFFLKKESQIRPSLALMNSLQHFV